MLRTSTCVVITSWSVRVLLLLLVATSYAQVAPDVSSPLFPPDENPRYFPTDIFAEKNSDFSFRAGWYGEQLRALKEPSLSQGIFAGGELVYRFTWLRTFHHPITVRVNIDPDGTGMLTSKMADGTGGYRPGKLIANSRRNISANEVQHILKLIEVMGFWHMPPEPEPEHSGVVNLDGAQWILEASDHGGYHVIDRWSPDKGPLRDLGLYLALTLGRLDVPAAAIY
jgi:hypothetical protein